LHVATAFAPVGHGAQLAPHVATLTSLAQAAPQVWKSALQVKPQVPSQVAFPLATTGQIVPHAPQSSSELVRLTHWLPQSVRLAPHPVEQAKVAPLGAQSGALAPHFALHEPQWEAWERSASHPLVTSPSQSA
jgi:hypothetical protein